MDKNSHFLKKKSKLIQFIALWIIIVITNAAFPYNAKVLPKKLKN